MVKIISIANRKGGVGKTTTAVNIATAMAAIGKRVLILDMDPQGNATTSLGINKNKCLFSTYDIMINNCKAEDAIVKQDIKKFDKTIDYMIGKGGNNISGGQKQRISIARAIAREPEIYIFDDSFSALDYKTDSQLRKELKKYTKDATTLIVAQRIGTIMNADKIVVLDKGVIVGIGKHKELLKNCDVYKEIAYSQLSKEELENE